MPAFRETHLIPSLQGASSPQSYRPDIDGLRAIAVAMVIGFHLFPAQIPAGFVGVDIFFVISGFLIGGILHREATSGGISILHFYCRRAVRILPAFLLVVLSTWLFGWLLLFADEYRELGKDIAASCVFGGNFRAWAGGGYFAREADMQPLLHLWSLGVEEQFYLAVPLVFGIWPSSGRWLLGGILGLAVASFLLGCYASLYHPSAAFYMPVTRAWELLAGVILAVSMSGSPRRRKGALVNNLISLSGCLLLALAIIFIKPGPGFPGVWAMLPVLGSCALIAAGPETLANRCLLSPAIMRYVGLVSYPWYLWHWPVLIFWKVAFGDALNWRDGLWIAGLSFMLASFTMHCIELPVRRSAYPIKHRAAILTLGLVPLLIMGILVASRIPMERLSSVSAFAAAQEARVEKFPYPFRDNFGRTEDFKIDAEDGITNESRVVLFAGDSHMQHYWPRIKLASDALGDDRLKWRMVTAGGHPMLPGVNRIDPGYDCDAFFQFVLSEAKRPEVRRVVLSCAWQVYFLEAFPPISKPDSISWLRLEGQANSQRLEIRDLDPVIARLEQSLRDLITLEKEVVIILPSVRTARWDPQGIARWQPELLSAPANVSQAEFDHYISPLRIKIAEAADQAGATAIDPCDYIAEDGEFRGRDADGRFRYRDEHHFRAFYVEREATFIDDLLKP
jgi:peptidoglycan/LPS O-acetylase OafA/YrhL